jgi:phosphoribosyl 1,2-cyclic phosphodiesterase
VKVAFWGTRGSLAAPGPDTVKYGGNTVCVEVRVANDHVLVLDAGSGIRRLGATLGPETRRVDLLLTHLHMDHIVGLGFFDALYVPGLEVHIWGPASTTQDLGARLTRYLSPPLFPVRVRDLDCRLTLHDVPLGSFRIEEFHIDSALVCHPGPTVGYRIGHDGQVLTYLTDHEPALATDPFPGASSWTSGFDLAHRADLLVHDAQFDDNQYVARRGWGHSSIGHALEFAAMTEARHLVAFHHDPTHDDAVLDGFYERARQAGFPFEFTVAHEGLVLELPGSNVDPLSR